MTTTLSRSTERVTGDRPTPGSARRTRRSLVVCTAVVLAALGWITVRGLNGNFVYYLTPSDIVEKHQATVDERVRLGGFVVPGSVSRGDDDLRFVVSDAGARLRVVDTGPVPRMFRPGQGVVLEGALGTDGAFHSDTLLVKHDGEYRAPDSGRDAG